MNISRTKIYNIVKYVALYGGKTDYAAWLKKFHKYICWLNVCNVLGVHASYVCRMAGGKGLIEHILIVCLMNQNPSSSCE